MTIKVKFTKSKLDEKVGKLPDKIKKEFGIRMKRRIADIIAERILSGKSPVKGARFAQYKNVKYKGRLSPVDMLKSGVMLNSLEVDQTSSGRLVISFGEDYAKYHNKGTKYMAQRKLLPTRRGEQFSNDISKKILIILRAAAKKAAK